MEAELRHYPLIYSVFRKISVAIAERYFRRYAVNNPFDDGEHPSRTMLDVDFGNTCPSFENILAHKIKYISHVTKSSVRSSSQTISLTAFGKHDVSRCLRALELLDEKFRFYFMNKCNRIIKFFIIVDAHYPKRRSELKVDIFNDIESRFFFMSFFFIRLHIVFSN